MILFIIIHWRNTNGGHENVSLWAAANRDCCCCWCYPKPYHRQLHCAPSFLLCVWTTSGVIHFAGKQRETKRWLTTQWNKAGNRNCWCFDSKTHFDFHPKKAYFLYPLVWLSMFIFHRGKWYIYIYIWITWMAYSPIYIIHISIVEARPLLFCLLLSPLSFVNPWHEKFIQHKIKLPFPKVLIQSETLCARSLSSLYAWVCVCVWGRERGHSVNLKIFVYVTWHFMHGPHVWHGAGAVAQTTTLKQKLDLSLGISPCMSGCQQMIEEDGDGVVVGWVRSGVMKWTASHHPTKQH